VRTVSSGGKPSPQRLRIHEVREHALSVYLHDGQMLSVPRLELWLSTDVDELELEPEVVLDAADNLERAYAEVTVGRVIDGDARYG
jgi:hypothetical protein